MTKLRYHWIAASLLLLCGLGAPPAAPAKDAAATAPSARGLIETLTHDVLAVLRDGKLSKEERKHKVEQLAYAQMDFVTLSRMALGRYWRDLPKEKREAFIEEFRKHLTATYGHTTDDYTDEDITVSNDRQESDTDWTVQTTITGTQNGVKKEVAKVDYRLRHKDNQWKIIDVTIDNVGLAANFRDQFSEIIANEGIDKLLKILHDKNAAAGM
jgi:phospholipid transport system substrate-binding protein